MNGFAVGAGLGIIKVGFGNKYSSSIEVVCADFVTNGTLSAMWNKVNATKNFTNMTNGGTKNVEKLDLSNSVVHITSQAPVATGSYSLCILLLDMSVWFLLIIQSLTKDQHRSSYVGLGPVSL